MFSRIWLINTLLAVFITISGIKTYRVWTQREERPLGVRSVEKPGPRPRQRSLTKKPVKSKMLPEMAYGAVVEKNLFSSQRKALELEEPKTEPAESDPEIKKFDDPGKTFTLYGVIIMDDYETALIRDPLINHGPGKSGESRDRWVKVGDTIGDLKVDEIRKDRILLLARDQRYQILLYRNDKPRGKRRVEKEAKPTVVGIESPKKAANAEDFKKK